MTVTTVTTVAGVALARRSFDDVSQYEISLYKACLATRVLDYN